MKASFDDRQPIFQQIAEMIEDDILNGTYKEGERIISVAQFARTFQINPATVVKGIALLVNEGILYKKRGLGMFVAVDARKIIMSKRRERFYNEMVLNLLNEAEKLELTTEDVIEMLKQKKNGSIDECSS
ncbi:GntR family transcriptional regulator [Thermoflavimicrobium daqui]|jgi:DNA-binding transcriptional regulator YhcF (GntR family)|uniref:GntR family transcriptional regulator n=1 Tax=Thermoflavimicrobium daqui TaxID=2137476 RepID=A0A364K216_9BACL|nr:GntR family transcriptional regulator [Thermoflavimicrobium daqui]RAL22078.1 GntR family transcriptional regulator [Thermoflavimicrobium daqui]